MFEIKEFSSLKNIGWLSDNLLKTHFSLYSGYVKSVNEILEKFKDKNLDLKSFQELKRRFGWEYNGMKLHELYFENISKEKTQPTEKILKEIEANFSSFKNWQEEFLKVASLRGIGWVVLVKENKKLFNIWLEEHSGGYLAGSLPILVLDVFEHAYFNDYFSNRTDYIKNFLNHINWEKVEKRL